MDDQDLPISFVDQILNENLIYRQNYGTSI
jgi:hypothetical protein